MLFEEDTSLLFRTSSRKVIVRKDCRTRRRSPSWKQYSAFGDDPALIASETAPPGKKWIMKFGGIYWIEFFNRTSFSGDGERSGMKMVVFLWRAIVGSSPNSSDWKKKERVRWRAVLSRVTIRYLYHVQKRVPVFLFDYFGDLLLALDRYNFKLLSLIFFRLFPKNSYSYSNCFLISVQVA